MKKIIWVNNSVVYSSYTKCINNTLFLFSQYQKSIGLSWKKKKKSIYNNNIAIKSSFMAFEINIYWPDKILRRSKSISIVGLNFFFLLFIFYEFPILWSSRYIPAIPDIGRRGWKDKCVERNLIKYLHKCKKYAISSARLTQEAF